jgi:hypothetical protein
MPHICWLVLIVVLRRGKFVVLAAVSGECGDAMYNGIGLWCVQ